MSDDDKDRLFVEEYVRTGDAQKACVLAGIKDSMYSMEVVARKTLARPEIKAAIAIVQKMELGNASVMPTRESIAAEMDEVYRKAFELEDLRSAIAAKSLQANLYGMLEQRVTLTHNVRVEEMTTAQLERLAQRGMKVIDVTPEPGNGEHGTTYIERAIAGGGGEGTDPSSEGGGKPT